MNDKKYQIHHVHHKNSIPVIDEGSDSKFIVFHHDDQLGEIGFIMNKDGTYSDVVFHDPETDFLDAVMAAVAAIAQEEKEDKNNVRIQNSDGSN